jgi:hypothetical protein
VLLMLTVQRVEVLALTGLSPVTVFQPTILGWLVCVPVVEGHGDLTPFWLSLSLTTDKSGSHFQDGWFTFVIKTGPCVRLCYDA